MASQEITVGYWPIRGLAGGVRNLLAYCEIPFQNRLYKDPEEWFQKDKYQIGFDFPNLPYIIDGETKLTESKALMEYVPIRTNRKDLLGDDDQKFIKVQVAWNAVWDLRVALNELCWTKGNFETEKEDIFANGKAKSLLTHLNGYLENKEWLCGFLSIADFQLFETIDLIQDLDAKKLDSYPKLTKFYKRFIEIPQIQTHRQSDKFIKTWFTPGMATWTNA